MPCLYNAGIGCNNMGNSKLSAHALVFSEGASDVAIALVIHRGN